MGFSSCGVWIGLVPEKGVKLTYNAHLKTVSVTQLLTAKRAYRKT